MKETMMLEVSLRHLAFSPRGWQEAPFKWDEFDEEWVLWRTMTWVHTGAETRVYNAFVRVGDSIFVMPLTMSMMCGPGDLFSLGKRHVKIAGVLMERMLDATKMAAEV